MKRPQQQLLNLAHSPTYDEKDFYVTACNQVAYEWVQAWPKWPTHCLILHGEKGSGKTHLARIWGQHAQAQSISLADLRDANIDQICREFGNIILEDLPVEFDQHSLFHLYNAIKQASGYLLITSVHAPQTWKVTLPDLSSRLRSALSAKIQIADEDLLRAIIHKLVADEQVIVPTQVIDYLLHHQDRSLSQLQTMIKKINTYAFATKRKITLPLVKEALQIN